MSSPTQHPGQVCALWTAAQAASADRHTMDTLGMPSPVLMERAALCVTAEVERALAASGAAQVLVLVGPGNNGGDGLAVARLLHGRGRGVTAALVTSKRNDAAAQQLALARAHGVAVIEALPERVSSTVVVDALLGTGSRGAPRGAVEEALGWLEGRGLPVVAVDAPSGIDVDSGAVPSIAAQARVTVTFQRSKPGLHLTPARACVGELVIADIGLVAPRSEQAEDERLALIDPGRVGERLAGLPAAAHKGRRGHVGVVGGVGGTPGAAVLAGTGALRAGAGLASLAMTDEALRRALVEARPELMLGEPEDRWIAAADVLVVGPGLTDAKAREGLAALDREDPRPMVWDASALDEFVPGASAGPRILTPHPGEAARLLTRLDQDQWTNARVQADRRAAAERLAQLCEAVVVLKGEGTVVAQQQDSNAPRLAIATTGGPALATAGSGDVLAGAVAALLARGLDPWDAACVGVHVHGLAGDACPPDGALAHDIADALPSALRQAATATTPARWPRLLQG